MIPESPSLFQSVECFVQLTDKIPSWLTWFLKLLWLLYVQFFVNYTIQKHCFYIHLVEFFFFMRRKPCFNLLSDANPYVQRAYLTQAATCSRGAGSELLLSSAASHTILWGVTITNIGCPLGPYVPAVMTCLGCPSLSSP